MHKTSLLAFFALFVLWINCSAQIISVDSMKARVRQAKNSTEKLAALQALCRRSSSMPADTLRLYADRALQLALQEGAYTKIWEAKYIYAFSLHQRSLVDSSLLICDQLIKEIRDLDKNFAIYHDVLAMKASCLKTSNKIKEAADVTYQMLASAEKFNDIDGQINAYNLLTLVGGHLTGFDDPNANDIYLRKCITWYKKAISLFRDERDYKKYDKILANLGMTYFQLPKSDYDSALYFVNQALVYAKEQNQLRTMAACFNVKASVFHDRKNLDSAEYYYKQEVAIEQQIGDPERIAISFSSLRAIYHQKKDYNTALAYDLTERDYCIKNHIPIDPALYSDLAQDYRDLGNYKTAGEILDTLIALKDSLYQANSGAAMAEIQTRYDVQKKENTIILQEYNITRKRYLIYGISGLLVLLLAVSFLTLRNRKQQQQHKIKEMIMENERKTQDAVNIAKEDERKRIIADLHDDVGGGLSTIRMVSDLIAEQNEQTQQLNQYALKISTITKDVTQRMNTIVWALNADNNTAQNLVEYIREYGTAFFEDSAIKFSSNLPEGASNILLSGLQRKNIFLCVKEALNNIYKHSGATKAWIEMKISNGLLEVAIHDDGKGISNENPFGNGLKNMQNRMNEINGEVKFSTQGSGASIFLQVSVAISG